MDGGAGIGCSCEGFKHIFEINMGGSQGYPEKSGYHQNTQEQQRYTQETVQQIGPVLGHGDPSNRSG